jgi:hypothetical protein
VQVDHFPQSDLNEAAGAADAYPSPLFFVSPITRTTVTSELFPGALSTDGGIGCVRESNLHMPANRIFARGPESGCALIHKGHVHSALDFRLGELAPAVQRNAKSLRSCR